MTRRQVTWLLAGLLSIPVLALSAFGFLAGTEAGTRWLLRTAAPWLPAPLSIDDPSGALLRGVTIGRLAWRDDTIDLEITGLGVDLELFPLIERQIRIVDLHAAGVQLEIEASDEPAEPRDGLPEIDLPVSIYVDRADIADIRIAALGENRDIRRLRFSGSFDDSELEVRDLELDAEWAGLALDGTLRLAGRYAAELTATWRYRHSNDLGFAGTLELDGDLRGYELVHDLRQPLELLSRGNVSAEGDLAIDIVNTWSEISWPIGERVVTTADGRLALQGGLGELAVALDTAAGLTGYPTADLTLRGKTDLRSLGIDTLTVSSGAGSLAASGDIGWSGTPSFDIRVDLQAVDASLVSPRFEGRIGMLASASGTLPEDGPVADIGIASISGSLNGFPLTGRARVSVAATTFDIAESELALGSNRIDVSGRIAERMDLSGRFDIDNMNQIDTRLAGAVTGRIDVAGNRASPTVTATLAAERPAWNAIAAETLTLDGSLTSGRSIDATLKVNGLVAGTLAVDEAALALDGSPASHRYTLDARSVEGRSLLAGSGRLADGGWQGRIDTLDVDTQVLAKWALDEPVDVAVSAAGASVSAFCLASGTTDGRICGGGDWRAAQGGSLELTIRALPLAALPVTLPAGATLSGRLEVDAEGAFDDTGIRGNANARLVDAAVDAIYDDEPYRLALTRAQLEAEIVNSRLASTLALEANDGAGSLDARFSIDDLRSRAAPIDGSGTLAIPDASIFAAFVPDIADPAGSIQGSLSATGSLSEPRFAGEVRLVDAAFGVRPAGIRITDMNVALRQRDPGQLELVGSARSGDGSLSIDGRTSLAADTGLRTEIDLGGENFTLMQLPDWQVAASPDIRLVLDDSAAVITGALDIPRADITVRSIPETATRPSGDVVVHGDASLESQRTRRIDVDVMASLGEDVRLSGFGLTTNVAGAVRIQGGSNRPYTGSGSLNLIEGRYRAYGQNLDIESGELIFSGPLDTPQLNVQAVRRVEQYDVLAGIRVSGTPRRLTSSLYSEPAMSDAEALSYLLSGRPLSASGDSEDADLLNKAAFALGLSQAGSIASQIRGELGLDTLKVEGGSETGRIVAGKRIGERLLVEYGYGLIDKLGSLLLRYELTRNLILESRTGTTSEIDLLYSVKKK